MNYPRVRLCAMPKRIQTASIAFSFPKVPPKNVSIPRHRRRMIALCSIKFDRCWIPIPAWLVVPPPSCIMCLSIWTSPVCLTESPHRKNTSIFKPWRRICSAPKESPWISVTVPTDILHLSVRQVWAVTHAFLLSAKICMNLSEKEWCWICPSVNANYPNFMRITDWCWQTASVWKIWKFGTARESLWWITLSLPFQIPILSLWKMTAPIMLCAYTSVLRNYLMWMLPNLTVKVSFLFNTQKK